MVRCCRLLRADADEGEHAVWIEGVPRLHPTVVRRAEVRSPPVVVDLTHPVGQVSLAPSPCQQLGKPSMGIKRLGQATHDEPVQR
jgi:hypothetical protein